MIKINIIKDIERFNHATVLVTGATGFIGTLVVNELISCNSKENSQIKLLLPIRDILKARKKYPPEEERFQCITFIESSMETFDTSQIEGAIDYIFHCASVTTSSIMIEEPVEVANGILIGTKKILELAYQKKIKSMVYISSMEVYGKVKQTDCLIAEDNLGDIDLFSSRSCYPLAKRMAEHYCYIYNKEYGVPVKIARLAQVFGYGVNAEDSRVYAQFARAALQNKDIVLHTKGLSMGNYCESMDAINALFMILTQGGNGEVYNVVNEKNTVRIREMAELVANKIAGEQIKVIFDIPTENSYGYAQDTELRLSSDKLRGLGWRPVKNLEEMYMDMCEAFKPI